jgi:hypothetical protein
VGGGGAATAAGGGQPASAMQHPTLHAMSHEGRSHGTRGTVVTAADLEVELLGAPHGLVYRIERRMEHELMQVLSLLLQPAQGAP